MEPQKFSFLIRFPRKGKEPACVGEACSSAKKNGLVQDVLSSDDLRKAQRKYPELKTLLPELTRFAVEPAGKPFVLVTPGASDQSQRVQPYNGPNRAKDMLKWIKLSIEETTTRTTTDLGDEDDSTTDDEETCETVNDNISPIASERKEVCDKMTKRCKWDGGQCVRLPRTGRRRGRSATSADGTPVECDAVNQISGVNDAAKANACSALGCKWHLDKAACGASHAQFCKGLEKGGKEACDGSFACVSDAAGNCKPKVGWEMVATNMGPGFSFGTVSGTVSGFPGFTFGGVSPGGMPSFGGPGTPTMSRECKIMDGKGKEQCHSLFKTDGVACKYKPGNKCEPDPLYKCYELTDDGQPIAAQTAQNCDNTEGCKWDNQEEVCKPKYGRVLGEYKVLGLNTGIKQRAKDVAQFPPFKTHTCKLREATATQRAATVAETIQQCPKHALCALGWDPDNNMLKCRMKDAKEIKVYLGTDKPTDAQCKSIAAMFKDPSESQQACDTAPGCVFSNGKCEAADYDED